LPIQAPKTKVHNNASLHFAMFHGRHSCALPQAFPHVHVTRMIQTTVSRPILHAQQNMIFVFR
jgi:hypothetical protein